ncbi:LemA family protein [Seonamhaeicola sediminis]|uniref:LemA family protein n=1 Tax=Seonamhaeicola sediminis TaxID=2528206 RepID=A0A562YHE2_9FLAO|nr:LemA family protein [Seonamhaeicola sediminis]TWO34472.1 LemA family protein [Seonamhaeicola sediminis]
MKKFLPWIIAAVIVFGLFSWGKGFNNTAVRLDESVKEAWGNVQTSYQRRNDLIGNLVNTVKSAANFEKSTLEGVINARAKASSISIDPSNITPEQLAQYNQVQGGLSGALKSLLVTVERYPELKTNQNFLKLQDELTSTENTIQTARTRFNKAIKPYNIHVRQFPGNLIAGILGFDEKPNFNAEVGAEKPVEVDEMEFK